MQRYSRSYASICKICKIYCVVTTVIQILLSGTTVVTATGMNISSYQSYTCVCNNYPYNTAESVYVRISIRSYISSMKSSETVLVV